jgi:hypothetical protein
VSLADVFAEAVSEVIGHRLGESVSFAPSTAADALGALLAESYAGNEAAAVDLLAILTKLNPDRSEVELLQAIRDLHGLIAAGDLP